MVKKLLCAIVLILAVVCVLASCGHEHSFSEWRTKDDATCLAEGTETRTCKCGESETRAIPAKGHSMVGATCLNPSYCRFCDFEEGFTTSHQYTNGKCSVCSDWMNLNIVVPEAPLTIDADDGQVLKFTRFYYGWVFNSNTSFDLYLYYDAEKIFDNDGETESDACWFKYKVLDEDGYTVNTGSWFTEDLCVGDKIKDVYTSVAYRLDPNRSYTIVVTGY